jgi:urease accessory protein
MAETLCHLEQIIGDRADPDLAHRLHHLAHDGGLEILSVPVADLPRRRFRAVTDRGTECAVALPRDAQLFDGAVLLLEERRAIVVKVGEQAWLKLKPAEGFALELGYLAGNLHWRVKFADGLLLVAVDVPKERYLARIAEHLADGRVTLVDDSGR